MRSVICPHCKNHRIVLSKVPRDMVVLMPCPACDELVLLFRQKAIAVSRHIIEHGTREERKAMIVAVIEQVLDDILPPGDESEDAEAGMDASAEAEAEAAPVEKTPPPKVKDHPTPATPITSEEVDRFSRIELKYLDNAAYFKKYFG